MNKENYEDKLWLVWKNPITRERHVIGMLNQCNDMYYFKYLENEGQNDLQKALDNGFNFLPAFPERDKIYESNELFYVFQNRLPSRKRRDVIKMFDTMNIAYNCSEFEFLKITGGKLPTDTLEFVKPIGIDDDGNISIAFYVAGTRYCDIDKIIKELDVNHGLRFRLEPTNEFDPYAIEILTENEEKLGYVPVFYSKHLYKYVVADNMIAYIDTLDTDADHNEKIKIQVKSKHTMRN